MKEENSTRVIRYINYKSDILVFYGGGNSFFIITMPFKTIVVAIKKLNNVSRDVPIRSDSNTWTFHIGRYRVSIDTRAF